MKKIISCLLIILSLLTICGCKNSKIEIGSIVTFGAYEQDSNATNGKEPIEWYVIGIEDDKCTLISKKVLDTADIYNQGRALDLAYVEFIEEWLNSDFLNKAFANERSKLIESEKYDCKVFLLSVDEVDIIDKKYRKAFPTDYAMERGAICESDGYVDWLTSTTANDTGEFKRPPIRYVDGDGEVINVGTVWTTAGIRPTIIVNIDDLTK